MNKATAISNLEAEHLGLPISVYKDKLLICIQVLNEDSTVKTIPEAIEDLNDIYFDCPSLANQCLFGESLFVISYTTDPSNPSPHVKH